MNNMVAIRVMFVEISHPKQYLLFFFFFFFYQSFFLGICYLLQIWKYYFRIPETRQYYSDIDWDGHEISRFGGLPRELYFPKGLYFPRSAQH